MARVRKSFKTSTRYNYLTCKTQYKVSHTQPSTILIMLHVAVIKKSTDSMYASLVLARNNSHLVRNEMRGHCGNLLFQVVPLVTVSSSSYWKDGYMSWVKRFFLQTLYILVIIERWYFCIFSDQEFTVLPKCCIKYFLLVWKCEGIQKSCGSAYLWLLFKLSCSFKLLPEYVSTCIHGTSEKQGKCFPFKF